MKNELKKCECNVCGFQFDFDITKLYYASKTVVLFYLSQQTAQFYECMDCQNCGCQNIIGTRIGEPIEIILDSEKEINMNLQDQISQERKKLNDCIDKYGTMHPETIKQSEVLDKLILIAQKGDKNE